MGRKRSEVIFRQPEPERPKPVTESVVIPGLRALVSGVLVMSVLVFGVQVWRGVWLDFPTVGLVWALVTLAIWGLSTWGDLLTWGIEEALDRDISGDGVIGEPDRRYVLVNAAPPAETEPPVERAHKRLCQFVAAADTSTATRDLEAQGFTRDEVTMFRDLLIRASYAMWRSGSKRNGWSLVKPVGVILAAIE